MCLGSRIYLLMYFALRIVDVNKLLNFIVYIVCLCLQLSKNDMMWSEFGLNSLRRNKIRNISELSCAAMAQPLSTTTMNRLMNDGKVKTLLKSSKLSMITSLQH